MTRNRDFKALVRRRMARTGERYSTARAHVVAAGRASDTASAFPGGVAAPGLLGGIRAIGGSQGDLAAARNLCVNAGLDGPDGRPISEALAFGLAGGVGFLYGVFEYGDVPTMTIVARNRSMPDAFCAALFDRLDIGIDVTETTGPKKAATELDRALADGRAALCTVGAGGLPHHGLPDDMSAMSPHLVGVIGIDPDTDRLWLDDRSPEPVPIQRAAFDAARAAYRAGKHRMVVVESVPDEIDWIAVLETAVRAGVEGFGRPPVPQFRSNVGIAGLTKWCELLTGGGKRGWSTVFGSGRRAATGLSRLYDCINHAYTSVDAGRPLYADFLDEAATVADRPDWNEAAQQWRVSGERWRAVSSLVVGAHPDLERYAELADERVRILDTAATESTADPASTMRRLHDEQQELVDGCDLDAEAAADVYRSIAQVVESVIELETAALAALR